MERKEKAKNFIFREIVYLSVFLFRVGRVIFKKVTFGFFAFTNINDFRLLFLL